MVGQFSLESLLYLYCSQLTARDIKVAMCHPLYAWFVMAGMGERWSSVFIRLPWAFLQNRGFKMFHLPPDPRFPESDQSCQALGLSLSKQSHICLSGMEEVGFTS